MKAYEGGALALVNSYGEGLMLGQWSLTDHVAGERHLALCLVCTAK